MDFKFDFDPEGFLNSLRKDKNPDSLTMTFEDYLKKNNVYEIYKERLICQNNITRHFFDSATEKITKAIMEKRLSSRTEQEIELDRRLEVWKGDYEKEMEARKQRAEQTFEGRISIWLSEVIKKDNEREYTHEENDAYECEQRRLAHISEFGH
jgi:hypothetical protein